MHSLVQLQKQQVGLRLPKYLVEKIDDMTQEKQEFYDNFDNSCKELKEILNDQKKADNLQTIEEFFK